MGADMLLTYIGAKRRGKWGDFAPIKTALKNLKRLVKKDDFKKDDWNDYKEYFSEDDDLRKEALDACNIAIDDLDGREVTTMYWNGNIYAATGGMSWGDAPTEAFAHFDLINRMPERILKKAGLR